jgi:PAS domain S-box-containing protein
MHTNCKNQMAGIAIGDGSVNGFAMPAHDITGTSDFDLGPSDLDLDLGDIEDQVFDPISLSLAGLLDQPSNEVNSDPAHPSVLYPQRSTSNTRRAGSSTVIDFTRRQSGIQHILEEIRDMLLVLSADGKILFASPACKFVTAYDPEQLNGKFLPHFIHDDDKRTFIREFNESIATGHGIKFHYRFKKSDNSFAILEASGHPHIAKKQVTFGTGKEGHPCDGFFLLSRPYPTRSCRLLDSFLEHKIENLRLMRRIAELKKEEEEELREQQQFPSRHDENNNRTPEVERQLLESTLGPTLASPTEKALMPRPAAPGASNHNFHSVGISNSGIGVVTQIDNPSYIDEIEMITGLRYGEGERSQGLSTGQTDGRLIQDDADIALLADQLRKSSDNGDKKKMKTSEEYVCTDCGTLASPEWRKGPSGPKTLCNACGCKSNYFFPLPWQCI